MAQENLRKMTSGWKPAKKDSNPCDPEEMAQTVQRVSQNDRDHEHRIKKLEENGNLQYFGTLAGDLPRNGTQDFTSTGGVILEVGGKMIPTGKKLVSTDVVEIGYFFEEDPKWQAVGFDGQLLTNA